MNRSAVSRRLREGPPAEISMRLLEIGVGVIAIAAAILLGGDR